MRSRVLPALGLSVVALALATSLTGTASATSGPSASTTGSPARTFAPAATCFSNLGGDTGVALTSQNFEAANDIYDSFGADDVKIGKKACKVTSVQVVGQYYGGTGPAASETVTFYENKKGKPGKVVDSQTIEGADSGGSFDITLDSPVKLKKKTTYWVGVQINMDFAVGGQWGWENTSDAKGAPAMWQNPGDGFATGCTKWANMQTCLGGTAPGPDFMFALTK